MNAASAVASRSVPSRGPRRTAASALGLLRARSKRVQLIASGIRVLPALPPALGLDQCQREAQLAGGERDGGGELGGDRGTVLGGKPAPARQEGRQHVTLEDHAGAAMRERAPALA